MYSIEIEENAERFLQKISIDDKKIILNKIYSIRHNPFRYLKKLQGQKFWRLRVMKYRVVVDMIISGKRIVVLKIGYRKNVYQI